MITEKAATFVNASVVLEKMPLLGVVAHPIVPAAREAEREESPGPRSSKLAQEKQ